MRWHKNAQAETYPLAGPTVSGLSVSGTPPNQPSIAASLDDYEILPGTREVSFSQFTEMGDLSYYSASEKARTKALAEQIRASGWISPLIVVVDEKGPYILEGGHRFDALRELGIKSFPAMVVLDKSAPAKPWTSTAQQQYLDFYRPEEYVPIGKEHWPDPSRDPVGALRQVVDETPGEVEQFLAANPKAYEPRLVSFDDAGSKPRSGPVVVVLPGNPHVVELGDNPEAKPAGDWLADVSDMYLGHYVPYRDFNEEFWGSVGKGSVMYHATDPENVPAIMADGLSPDSRTRGLSNRGMGAAVFTSHDPDRVSSYGSAIVEIDVGRMKADGYMPAASQEEPFEEERMRADLACRIGLRDYCPYANYESEGLDQETVALFGHVPAKYLRTT